MRLRGAETGQGKVGRVPVNLMFLAGLSVAALVWRKSKTETELVPETKNPAELTGAIAFGLLYGVVLSPSS